MVGSRGATSIAIRPAMIGLLESAVCPERALLGAVALPLVLQAFRNYLHYSRALTKTDTVVHLLICRRHSAETR